MSFFLLTLQLAHARFIADQFTPAHLSLSACIGGVATNIVRVQECVNLPAVCTGAGRLCLVQTTNANRMALVCNAQAGVLYNFCE